MCETPRYVSTPFPPYLTEMFITSQQENETTTLLRISYRKKIEKNFLVSLVLYISYHIYCKDGYSSKIEQKLWTIEPYYLGHIINFRYTYFGKKLKK